MSNKNDVDLILATARELYGRAVYSHKVHEAERELRSKSVTALNIINIVLSAITTILAVISASLKPLWALVSTAAAAAASVCFAIWQASFDPASKEQQQRTAAKELLAIREQFLLLIQRCNMSNPDVADLQKSLGALTAQLLAAYKFTRTPNPKHTVSQNGTSKVASLLSLTKRSTSSCRPNCAKSHDSSLAQATP